MKKLFLLAVLVIAGTTSMNAQFLKAGIKAGANFANYSGGLDGIDYKNRTDFHVGAVAELKISENFSIQPELLYTAQGTKIKTAIKDFEDKTAYISVPVLAKYYILSNRLSVEVGPQFAFLVSNKDKVNLSDQKSFDFSLAGGIGLNITENLRAHARYTIGLTEVSKDADVKNAVFQVGLGYMLF
ncbi:porin family protein [Flavobacterium sp. '19STA2R22 D10 B1']|uniref:porin family protein n=1 Tax=Flavobacterium aerium TaxID=3037261 RepID=UPI00278C23DB|nr:porin family protein [Flavobacterium sp. '19STA2R22 D10 B1']